MTLFNCDCGTDTTTQFFFSSIITVQSAILNWFDWNMKVIFKAIWSKVEQE